MLHLNLLHLFRSFLSRLRVESLFTWTDQDCHVWCKFVNFGTLKDERLLIIILISRNCLCHRNLFQNGVNTFSKMVNNLLPKSSKFCKFPVMRFLFKFHQQAVQILIKKCMESLQTSNVGSSNGNIKYPIEKSFFGIKFAFKTFP